MNPLDGWHADPAVLGSAAIGLTCYGVGLRLRRRRLERPWPVRHTVAAIAAVGVALIALESPLDAAADLSFAPHMLQHLLLTDLVAPLILLAAPLPLLLGALSPAGARRVVRILRTGPVRAIAFPACTWGIFIASLYVLHAGPLFELALDDPRIHVLEHAIFLATSLLFWLPVIGTPPTPWTDGPLAYPLRMLYVLIAMPAEGFLGFALYGAPHVLYPHYLAAGLDDQHAAGELMWIGSGLAMFVAFMLVGVEWGVVERRTGERENLRLERSEAIASP